MAGAYYSLEQVAILTLTTVTACTKLRRQGSKADLIILNDKDFEKFAKAVATTDTYFTQTGTKGKRVLNNGVSELTSAFSTNYIENIYDDPFCPEGTLLRYSTAKQLSSGHIQMQTKHLMLVYQANLEQKEVTEGRRCNI